MTDRTEQELTKGFYLRQVERVVERLHHLAERVQREGTQPLTQGGNFPAVASAELGQDVVYAVQTGRHLIDQQECDCITASDYTSDLPRSAAMPSYAAALSFLIVAVASAASLLILASGWTL